jgi:hypothetical protein
MRSALIFAALAACAGAAGEACRSTTPDVLVEPWGPHSIRVRIAPPCTKVVEPPYTPLLPEPPASVNPVTKHSVHHVQSGNLEVEVDPATGFMTAKRAHDGAVLLRQTELSWGQPSEGAKPGSVSATVKFAGTRGEKIYGLGEHRTGRLMQVRRAGPRLIAGSACCAAPFPGHPADQHPPLTACTVRTGAMLHRPHRPCRCHFQGDSRTRNSMRRAMAQISSSLTTGACTCRCLTA